MAEAGFQKSPIASLCLYSLMLSIGYESGGSVN